MRLIDADSIQEELAALILYLAGTPKGECIEYAHDLIDAQPTIDIEPVKHAHWIIIAPHGDKEEPDFACSSCYCISPVRGYTRYCPNCGARMDGEVEGRKK